MFTIINEIIITWVIFFIHIIILSECNKCAKKKGEYIFYSTVYKMKCKSCDSNLALVLWGKK